MKNFFILIFLVLLFTGNIFYHVSAKGINVKKADGICEAEKSLTKIKKSDYDKIWIDPTLDYKYSLDADAGDSHQNSTWLKKIWEFQMAYRNAMELCAVGDLELCKEIIDHIKYISKSNKMLLNKYKNTDDHDYYEATLHNNFNLGHLMTAYGIAFQQLKVDDETHEFIGRSFKKAIKSNSRLKKNTSSYNNHNINSARAYALFGTIWEDKKSIELAKKSLKKYYKNLTKEGAIKAEAVRGVRALYYTGKSIGLVISILNILEDGGEIAWTKEDIDWVRKSVKFYIDASDDNMLIYKWAKKKKHNTKGNPKRQEMTHAQQEWVRPFVKRYSNSDPKLVSQILNQLHVKLYLTADKKKTGGMWLLVDTKCFYPIEGI
tara:strand:+ start:366 stop:1493 length:1128 start_codon:yes stop_codon:yes gene_type:complete